MWQSHSDQRIANKIRNMQMTVLGKTSAGGDLRTLLATRTKQSVRCILFGRVTRAITYFILKLDKLLMISYPYCVN